MSQATVGYQIRTQASSGSVPVYTIETVVQSKGDLPDLNVFLLRINVRNNPSADTLERVCTVTDLTDYTPDRVAARLAGQSLYRVSACLVSYRSLDTAIAAKDLISEQVTALSLSYVAYSTQFSTSGYPLGREGISWPGFATSLRDRLAKEACDASALKTAQTELLLNNQTAVASAEARLSELLADQDQLVAARALQAAGLGSLQLVLSTQEEALAALQLYAAEVGLGLAAYDATTSADPYFGPAPVGTVRAQQASISSQTSVAIGRLTTVSNSVDQIQAGVTALDAAIAVKIAQVDAATSALRDLQQLTEQYRVTLVAYEQAFASAVAAARAVDPKFDVATGCCC